MLHEFWITVFEMQSFFKSSSLCWIDLHIFNKIQASLTDIHQLWHTYLHCAWTVFCFEVKFKEVAGFIHFCLIFIILIFLT